MVFKVLWVSGNVDSLKWLFLAEKYFLHFFKIRQILNYFAFFYYLRTHSIMFIIRFERFKRLKIAIWVVFLLLIRFNNYHAVMWGRVSMYITKIGTVCIHSSQFIRIVYANRKKFIFFSSPDPIVNRWKIFSVLCIVFVKKSYVILNGNKPLCFSKNNHQKQNKRFAQSMYESKHFAQCFCNCSIFRHIDVMTRHIIWDYW